MSVRCSQQVLLAENEMPDTDQAVASFPRRSWWLRVRNVLRWICSLFIALLLLTSGYTHISNPYQFLQAIYAYRIVSDWLGIVLAGFLPCLHISLAIALLMRVELRRPALGMSAALLASYAIVQSIALSRGLNISCGCFSSYQTGLISFRSIGIAAGASAVSVVGFWATPPAQAHPT
jgi:hypothetical protein